MMEMVSLDHPAKSPNDKGSSEEKKGHKVQRHTMPSTMDLLDTAQSLGTPEA
jgi:hypothetical protein